MQQLSMGMSEDYQLALKAGATMVRLGRILFGDQRWIALWGSCSTNSILTFLSKNLALSADKEIL